MPTFAQPLWLLAGLLICLGAAIFIRVNILRRKKELQHFASPHLLAGLTNNVSLSRRRLKNILLILGLSCLFVALAHPQYGNRWIEVKHKGIDILIGVDVSKSMLVRDVKPNRLLRAKLAIRDFVDRLEGDRVGLLPFAGTAFLMCPLTTDYDAFNASLDTLDVNTIPMGGTDIGTAIREGGKALANEANHKIFVLVTDGEDLSEEALKAAEQAKEEKMTIYTIGVGTPAGELVPVSGRETGRFAKDAAGNFVTSRLDQQTLTAISETTGGLYVPLGSMGQGFDTIYQQKLALIPKEEHAQRKRKVPIERFPWPLGAAVLFLSMDFLLTGRKSSWALRLPFVKTAGRRKKQQAATLGLLLLAVISWSAPTQASEGENLFRAGKYELAMQFYQAALKKDAEHAGLHYNLGTTLYAQKKYKQAEGEFEKGLKTDDLSLQAKSYFNQGKTRYYIGEETYQTDPEHTVKLWQQSIAAYKAALALEPNDELAASNRDIVQKLLDQLQKEQEQEKSPSQCKNPQNDDKDGDKEQDKKEENKEQQEEKDGKEEQEKEEGEKNNKQEEGQQQQGEQENQEKQQASADDQKEEQAAADNDQAEQDKEEEKKNQKSVAEDNDEQDKTEEEEQAAAAAAGQQDNDEGEERRQNMERRLLGKMTEEEARNLLESLKGEQGELNFIPQTGRSQGDPVRDW